MSWTLPKHKYATSLILDAEEWNENLALVATELAGQLNEHNWTAAALQSIHAAGGTDYDIVCRVGHDDANGDPLATPSSNNFIPPSMSWEAIPGSTYVRRTRGGQALVIARAQIRGPGYYYRSSDQLLYHKTLQHGWQAIIMVDGVPRYDSLLGGADMSNDKVKIRASTAYVASYGWVQYAEGPGIRAKHTGVVLTCLVNLPPGEHTFEIGVRSIGPTPPDITNTTDAYELYGQSYSTIVVDLWS